MKFILTKELGRLARWLRILGFDALYYNKDNLGTLVIQALRENRTIVTRSKNKIDNLPKNTVLIVAEIIKEQLQELKERLNLTIDENKMFTRCTLCNELLSEVIKETLKNLVPEYVYKTQEFFMQCPSCKRIYWQGSHWGNVIKVIKELQLRLP